MLMYLTVNLKYTFHIYKYVYEFISPVISVAGKLSLIFLFCFLFCLVFMLKKKCSEIVNVICFEI